MPGKLLLRFAWR